MSEPYIGQIIMFGGNFAPRSWAFCDGQLLPISQNTALFSILGTTYGGDGRTSFGLPDLRGRVAIHAGNGPGLSPRRLGDKGGQETVTLTEAQLPSHTHQFTPRAQSEDGETDEPQGNFLAKAGGGETIYAGSANADMGGGPTGSTGGSQAHNNMQPYNAVNFIICLFGIYPSRS
jgi:microcystin-dependent protein